MHASSITLFFICFSIDFILFLSTELNPTLFIFYFIVFETLVIFFTLLPWTQSSSYSIPCTLLWHLIILFIAWMVGGALSTWNQPFEVMRIEVRTPPFLLPSVLTHHDHCIALLCLALHWICYWRVFAVHVISFRFLLWYQSLCFLLGAHTESCYITPTNVLASNPPLLRHKQRLREGCLLWI